MAMYDFGGGKDSLLSNFAEYHIAGGEANAENRSSGTAHTGNSSGKKTDSAASSDSGISWKTVVFLLFCLFWLFCEIKS